MSRTNETIGRGGRAELVVGELQGEDREDDADERLAGELLARRRPRLRCLRILMKSSRKPTRPSPVMRKSTSRPLTVGALAGDEVRDDVGRDELATMTAPPIVGVPRLVWCEVGPSSRMNWP